MPPVGEVLVVEPGLLTTIQDDHGRPGLGRFGIPPGGALDPATARLANQLVGNVGAAPVLEITLHGPTLQWTNGAHIGLAGGDLGALSRGLRLAPGHSYRLQPGTTLAFDGVRTGARAYLAVEGGFAIEPVLGSVATDRRSGFGGLEGRALRAGDVLRFPASQTGPLRSAIGTVNVAEAPVLIIPTPAALGWFTRSEVDRLCATAWIVAPESDRNGIRLTGARLEALTDRLLSLGVPVGAVQVPPGGEPIVTMVDGPVTGGYPVIGLVPRLEHGRLAQVAPGSTLHFQRSTVRAARRLADERDAAAAGHAGIEFDEGDQAAGWAR